MINRTGALSIVAMYQQTAALAFQTASQLHSELLNKRSQMSDTEFAGAVRMLKVHQADAEQMYTEAREWMGNG